MTKLSRIAAFALPACALLALGQAAAASDGVRAAAAAQVQASSSTPGHAEAAKAKRYCLNLVPDTGSRMARRVCKTKAEWSDEGVEFSART